MRMYKLETDTFRNVKKQLPILVVYIHSTVCSRRRRRYPRHIFVCTAREQWAVCIYGYSCCHITDVCVCAHSSALNWKQRDIETSRKLCAQFLCTMSNQIECCRSVVAVGVVVVRSHFIFRYEHKAYVWSREERAQQQTGCGIGRRLRDVFISSLLLSVYAAILGFHTHRSMIYLANIRNDMARVKLFSVCLLIRTDDGFFSV